MWSELLLRVLQDIVFCFALSGTYTSRTNSTRVLGRVFLWRTFWGPTPLLQPSFWLHWERECHNSSLLIAYQTFTCFKQVLLQRQKALRIPKTPENNVNKHFEEQDSPLMCIGFQIKLRYFFFYLTWAEVTGFMTCPTSAHNSWSIKRAISLSHLCFGPA